MKVVRFDAVGQPLRLDHAKDPTPGRDEVVVRLAACGICGSDLHMAEDPVTFGIPSGAVLGHEFAGEIVSLGTDVKELVMGDRVAVGPMFGCGACAACARGEPAWCKSMRLIGGGYAEFATVAARQCRKLPDDLPLSDSALAEPVAVGLHCVVRSGMKRGTRVLILGAGPIGLTVAFWARRMGAASVIVADLNHHQRTRALTVGVTGFAISGPGLGDALDTEFGGAPDIVFECVGKRGLLDATVALVRIQGTVVGVVLCVGGDAWDAFRALSKEVTIVMSAFFTMHEFSTAVDALGVGMFRPQALISDRIGLGDVPATFAALHHRTTQCKVLIEF